MARRIACKAFARIVVNSRAILTHGNDGTAAFVQIWKVETLTILERSCADKALTCTHVSQADLVARP